MKIRNPKLIQVAGWLGFQAARALVRTLRLQIHFRGPTCYPIERLPQDKRYIFAQWHETMLVPILKFGRPELGALVSKHADGQLLQMVLRAARMTPVEGSTNRGGVLAVRQIVGDHDIWKHIVITVDGPRGPRQQVQMGSVYCASRGGLEIIPLAIAFNKAWRAKSWDKFAVPYPRSKVKMIFGPPIAVPDGIRTAELEEYRVKLQASLDQHTTWAEEWAKTDQLPDAAKAE